MVLVDMVARQGYYPHQEDARAGAVGHHCFLHLPLHCITIIPLPSISRFLMLSKSLENDYVHSEALVVHLVSVLQVYIVSSVRSSFCYDVLSKVRQDTFSVFTLSHNPLPQCHNSCS